MRIPSTKRICFVGKHKPTSSTHTIDEYIQTRRVKKQTFTPRDIDEELKSRNCQKIQKSIRDEIVKVRRPIKNV